MKKSFSLFLALAVLSANAANYTVLFDANGGSAYGEGKFSFTNQTIECGVATRLLANVFERGGLDGYVFTGWRMESSSIRRFVDSSIDFVNCAKVKDLAAAGGTVKLYAVWEKRADRAARLDRSPVAFAGKWRANGTSITWYNENVGASGGAFTEGYQTRVQKVITFGGYSNGGQNGCRISASTSNPGDGDLVTIEHGINDMGQQFAVGVFADYLEPGTNMNYFAEYRRLIDKVRTAKPNAQIVLCTPRKGILFGTYLPDYWDKPGNKGRRLQDYVNAVFDIAEYEKLPVCDYFTYCADQSTLRALSIEEALHPNDAGYQLMADELIASIKANVKGLRPIADFTPGIVSYRKGEKVELSEPVKKEDWFLIADRADADDHDGRIVIKGPRPNDMPLTLRSGTVELDCDFGAATNVYSGSVTIKGDGDLILGGVKDWYFGGRVDQKGSGRVVVPKGAKMFAYHGGDYNLWIEGEVDSDGYGALPGGPVTTVADGGVLHIRRGYWGWGPAGFGWIKVMKGGKAILHNNSMGLAKNWAVEGGVVENLSKPGESQIYKLTMSNGGRLTGSAFAAGDNAYIKVGYPGAHIDVKGTVPSRVDCEAILLGYSKNAKNDEPVHLKFNHEAGATLEVGAVLKAQEMKSIESAKAFGYVKTGAGTLVLEGGAEAETASFRFDSGVTRMENSSIRRFVDSSIYRFGAIGVGGNATIEIGEGVTLAFADSAANEWTPGKTFVVKGWREGAIRIGESAKALTVPQLAAIRIEGAKPGRCAALDDNGYLVLKDGAYDVRTPLYRSYVKATGPTLVWPGVKLAEAEVWSGLSVKSSGHFVNSETPKGGFNRALALHFKSNAAATMDGKNGKGDEGIYFLKIAADRKSASFWAVQDMWYGRLAAKVELFDGEGGVWARVVKTARRGRNPDGTNQKLNQFFANVDWDSPELPGLDDPAPALKESGDFASDSWVSLSSLGGVIFVPENLIDSSIRRFVDSSNPRIT